MAMVTYRCPACLLKFELNPAMEPGAPSWPHETACPSCGAIAIRKRRGPLHTESFKGAHPRSRKSSGAKRLK